MHKFDTKQPRYDDDDGLEKHRGKKYSHETHDAMQTQQRLAECFALEVHTLNSLQKDRNNNAAAQIREGRNVL